jgi:fructose-1,6-bisphosphatase I
MSELDAKQEVAGHRNPLTLTRVILSEEQNHPGATGDFTQILQSIQLATKVIANACRKAGIANLYGVAGDTNSSGDAQKKLDVFANDCFVNALSFSQKIALMISEENEQVIEVKGCDQAKYIIAFDPLDGSSNIDANISVGTIFGIYRKKDENKPVQSETDVLIPGRELVCAGYTVYGSATMLVLSTGNGVNGFTLDPSLGEFILTHPNIKIPPTGKIYAINEGNHAKWDEGTRRFIHHCKNPADGKSKSLRYVGSMVADVHRTLLYGGVFCYPGDVSAPKGKLRLLYEVGPIAYIVKQAGGRSTTGVEDPLDVMPVKIHERCPIFTGSEEDIVMVEKCYKEAAEAQQ